MAVVWRCEDVDVIWHHDPGVKCIADVVPVQERILDDASDVAAPEEAGPVPLVEGGLDGARE